MLITVKSFAGFRHMIGKQMQIELAKDNDGDDDNITVMDLLEALCATRPDLRPLLFSGDNLRDDVNVFVSGKNIASQRGLQTPLVKGDEVALFPAAIGG